MVSDGTPLTPHPPSLPPPATRKEMPSSSSSEPPRSGADPVGFNAFWHEVEQLGRAAELTDKKTMESVIRYAGRDAHACKPPATKPETPVKHNEAIPDLHPGLSSERRFYRELMDLVFANQRIRNVTHASVSDYYRSFLVFSDHLVSERLVQETDLGSLYLDGFPEPFVHHVKDQLRFTNSTVRPSDGYPLDKVHDAVKWVLSSVEDPNVTNLSSHRLARGGLNELSRNHHRHQSPPRERTPPPRYPPLEHSPLRSRDSGDIQVLLRAMTALTQTVSTALPPRVQTSSTANPTQPPPSTTPGVAAIANHPQRNPPSGSGCMFCSGRDHYIRECTIAKEYIQAGKAVRNWDGRLALPNNRFPPGETPGRNLREKFDHCLASSDSRQHNQPSVNYLRGSIEHAHSVDQQVLPFHSFRPPSQSDEDDIEADNSRKSSDKSKPSPNISSRWSRQIRSSAAQDDSGKSSQGQESQQPQDFMPPVGLPSKPSDETKPSSLSSSTSPWFSHSRSGYLILAPAIVLVALLLSSRDSS